MANPNNIEKYIYKFLTKLDLLDYSSAKSYLQSHYQLEENYTSSVIEECIKSNYVDGIFSVNSVNNYKHISISDYIYITREGYKFINQYRLNKINLFWIPFKNLVIIIATAIITAIATSYFDK